jgi:membrane associated rhomboid family serine protease
MASAEPVKRNRAGLHRLLASLNGDGRYGMALLGACALLLLPVLAGDAGRAALRYDRVGLADGQLWRLLTGHFVHLGLEHAALNFRT